MPPEGFYCLELFQLGLHWLDNCGVMATTYQYYVLRHDPLKLLQVLCLKDWRRPIRPASDV